MSSPHAGVMVMARRCPGRRHRCTRYTLLSFLQTASAPGAAAPAPRTGGQSHKWLRIRDSLARAPGGRRIRTAMHSRSRRPCSRGDTANSIPVPSRPSENRAPHTTTTTMLLTESAILGERASTASDSADPSPSPASRTRNWGAGGCPDGFFAADRTFTTTTTTTSIQYCTTSAQDGAHESRKRAPRKGQEGEHEPTIRDFRPKKPPGGPKRPPRDPKRPPRGPTRPPRGPKRGPQTAPKRPQNCLQEAPERPPTISQRTSKRPLTHNPGTVAGWAEGH